MATVRQLRPAGDGAKPAAATYTISQAAARLGISERHARQLITDGRFPCRVLELGRRKVIPIAALEALLQQ